MTRTIIIGLILAFLLFTSQGRGMVAWTLWTLGALLGLYWLVSIPFSYGARPQDIGDFLMFLGSLMFFSFFAYIIIAGFVNVALDIRKWVLRRRRERTILEGELLLPPKNLVQYGPE